jgi:hypothetical protein
MYVDGDTALLTVVEIWCTKTRWCMMVHTHHLHHIDCGVKTPCEWDGDPAPFSVIDIWCAKTRWYMMAHTHHSTPVTVVEI